MTQTTMVCLWTSTPSRGLHIHMKQMTSFMPISSQAKSDAASLETLPAELKLMILLRLYNKKSLQSIIRASPTFLGLYRSDSEVIYTAIAIRQLAERGFDVFGSDTILEIYVLKHTWSIDDVTKALRILYAACQQYKSTNAKGNLKCAVNVCTLALNILHAVSWNLPEVEHERAAVALRQIRRNGRLSGWSQRNYPYGWRNYRTISIGNRYGP